MLKFNKEITELEALLSTEETKLDIFELTFNSLDEFWITKNKKYKGNIKGLNLKAFSDLVVRQSS
jgi:hypothetical protein